LGDRAGRALAAHGVDCAGVVRTRGRMGLYFLESGAGLRPSAITYDRAGSAMALAAADTFDFPTLLAGARLLHLSGITAALGPNGLALSRAAIAAARTAGVPISFDPNYRESLWRSWDSNAREALLELVGEADVLFSGHRDMALLLDRTFSTEGAERRQEAAEAAFEAFPRMQVLASTARHPVSHDHHRLSARVATRSCTHETAEIDITGIVDRIGTGDAFAAGVVDAWLAGAAPQTMAELGLTLSALKHTIPGDFYPLGRPSTSIMGGEGFDVRR